MVQEELHSYEDLRCLREAKKAEKCAPTVSLNELKRQIGGLTKAFHGIAQKAGFPVTFQLRAFIDSPHPLNLTCK